MSADDAVIKARAVLHEAIAAAGVSEFAALAIRAAAESYVKALRSACGPHATRTHPARDSDPS